MSATATDHPTARTASGPRTSPLTLAALAVAAAGVAGSLSLSWGLRWKACPLCFYQRAFVMGAAAVLAMGLLTGATERLGLLALPLAVAGLGVALFHVWLEGTGKLECPAGLLGLGSAPQQSLGAFVVLTALLAGDALRGGGHALAASAGAALLGAVLAAASCTSNPPMPPAPKAAYSSPPDVCRPTFVPPGP